ncbi:hypothetical protein GCM10011584_31740 [Nocardioides phosphati]|uniref:Replication initiation protein n=1 Tax=Nocardioides phosphati TaxID=1867775 RepID=A0ABQ2NE95_9ACTN|nr:replication initiator [Nocardioides phosphati]GGO93321.1 hypothetical protein GCM10011584_31740 [Nocardioides phosphati]
MGTAARANLLTLIPRLLPDAIPDMRSEPIPDLPPVTDRQRQQLLAELRSPGNNDFADALAATGNCSRPIRLIGSSMRVDTTTGEIVSSFASAEQPLSVLHVPCRNRRASKCPSCSRTYAGDAYWLFRTGISGGKTIPPRVRDNPLVFATFTAPSFGAVHGHRDGPCRPRRGNQICEHGRPIGCSRWHAKDDPQVGQPLCADCYDYTSHLLWQWWAPTLWQRFNVAIKRTIAKHLGVPGSMFTEHAYVNYAKVSELQARGAIHFHAMVRLDGPKSARGYEPAPDSVDAQVLARLIKEAAESVRLEVPGATPDDVRRVLCFGAQLDVVEVHPGRREDAPDEAITDDHVARYLAKYATKSVADCTVVGNAHHARLRATAYALAERSTDATPAWEAIGQPAPYERMNRAAHELGFHGQFATKSRMFGLTFTQLRTARRRVRILEERARATGEVLDLAAREAELYARDALDDETTVVISQWTYAGTGWANEAQTLLANASAAAAREYTREEAAERRNQSTNSRGDQHHEDE